MSEDPYYAPLYLWEARGDVAPTDHTDWDLIEGYKPRHRADTHHRNRRRSYYYARAVRPETAWGALDGYQPRHAA